MNEGRDRLNELLPAVHRKRDAEEGYPLRALLQVIEGQGDVLEANIEQLYENWFIETAETWMVPYIGDLVGYRPVHEAGEPGDPATEGGLALNRVLIPRRDVANTIGHRRRKGTLALLEDLAFEVAGWRARAVEFFKLLVETQALNYLHLDRGRTVDLRDGDALELLGSPFERLAHTVDVRRPSSRYGSPRSEAGRFNLPSVGVFVWRLRTYSVTGTSAYCLEEAGSHNFTFSILGNDSPLFTRAEAETEPGIADESNLPVRIRRRALEADLPAESARLYGHDRSLLLRVGEERLPVSPESLMVADLSDWQYVARPGTVAVDPELGRLSFPPGEGPKDGIWVYYRYGMSGDLGGGEYQRTVSQPACATIYAVGANEALVTIGDALALWREQQPLHAVVEIRDSAFYVDPIEVDLQRDQTLQLRAAPGARPVIRLLDRQPGRPDSLRVRGEAGSRFTLDGLMITGRPVRAEGGLATLRIRHSTLVPGWNLHSSCEPHRPAEPSVELVETCACLVIENSIVGSIQVSRDEVTSDPSRIEIRDSVVDATAEDLEALGGVGWPLAHATLTIARTTVIGHVQVHSIELAENSIFLGEVCVGRSQFGCVRFCYMAPGSRTPQRYRCQPDLVVAAVPGTDPDADRLREREALSVRPHFDTLLYGTPQYCRLSLWRADEIRRGADDRSEMGVFHDLFEPQRRANLEARLTEHVPAAADAGIFFAS